MVLINGYLLSKEGLKNDNSGYAKWGFAYKDGREVFIKEFLTPTYPVDETVLSPRQIESKRAICRDFEMKKRKFYNVLNRCSTGNIITVDDFFRFENKYYMVTEKIDTETIRPEEISRLPYEQKFLILKILLHSIHALHENGIVHGDLKPANILFKRTRKDFFTAKIIDFDSSFLENDPPVMGEEELQGDQVYLSPEALLFIMEQNEVLTHKVDVFTLGILFHQYLCGELPGYNTYEYDYICEAVLDDSPISLSYTIPEYIRDIIRSMLNKDPERRPDVSEIFEKLTGAGSLYTQPKETERKADNGAFVPKSTGFRRAGDL